MSVLKEVIASWISYPSKWKRLRSLFCIVHIEKSVADVLLEEIPPSPNDAYVMQYRLRVWQCNDCKREEFWLVRCTKERNTDKS